MFSPALIRYIIDSEGTSEPKENKKVFMEQHILKSNSVDLNSIKNEFGLLQKLFLKAKLVLK